jgi:hypothetical protein
VSAPWWQGLSPVEAQVSCGGREHRLRWAAGELRALDHTDAEGERILGVLGGQPCRCLDALDAWAWHADDLRFLVFGRRGPADPAPVLAQSPPRGGPADGLVTLLGLGRPLQDRLTATIVAAWRERLRDRAAAAEGARPALQAALYGRVTAELRAWTGRPDLQVDLTMISEARVSEARVSEARVSEARVSEAQISEARVSEARAFETREPALTDRAGGVAAELPFGWLSDVWAKGLCTLWGRFCLAAAPAEAGWVLSTVGQDLGPARPITVGNAPEEFTAGR